MLRALMSNTVHYIAMVIIVQLTSLRCKILLALILREQFVILDKQLHKVN